MAEGIHVRTLSVILVYKLVYYFLHVSVMDKQLRVFEVIMHILCSVLGSACVTLMNTISFLRTEGCLSFFYRYGDQSWWFSFLIIMWNG